MNKIVYYCFATIALLVLTGCAHFRINMSSGYGPHYPPTPAPSGLAERWVDVEDWQSFLKGLTALKVLQDPHYPNGVFDEATEAATEKFQRTPGKIAKYELPDTGCVNFATYHKAVQEGMPKYKAVRTPNKCVEPATKSIHKKYSWRVDSVETIATAPLTTGDSFRDKWMKSKCYDAGAWYDVLDWQTFLVNNGYMAPNPIGHNTSYTPGTFDPNTVKWTTMFQQACGITGDPVGEVGPKTWAWANNFAINMKNEGGGQNLLSHDLLTLTKENQTGCPPPPPP